MQRVATIVGALLGGAVGAGLGGLIYGWWGHGAGAAGVAMPLLVGLLTGVTTRAAVRRRSLTVGLGCAVFAILGIFLGQFLQAHDTAANMTNNLTVETNIVFDSLATERGFPIAVQEKIDANGGVNGINDAMYDRVWLTVRDDLAAMSSAERRERVAAAMGVDHAQRTDAQAMTPGYAAIKGPPPVPFPTHPVGYWLGVGALTVFNFGWLDAVVMSLAAGVAYLLGSGQRKAG